MVHFPALLASSFEEVRDHCIDKTNDLLLALALTRDAGGTIFDLVSLNRRSGDAMKFSVSSSYVGNMLTGHLSGEGAERIDAYLRGLQDETMNHFLVSLYKEARRERSRDFQYVRFWQILETIAEGRNYDPNALLLDYDGNPMVDGGQHRRIKGSIAIVFNLLRESGIGNQVRHLGERQCLVCLQKRCCAPWRDFPISRAISTSSSRMGTSRHGEDTESRRPRFVS